MEEYTVLLRELIDEDFLELDSIVDVLNNEEDDFKSFGDLLKREIRLEYLTKPINIKEIIKESFKNKKIIFNKTSLDHWLDGKMPINSIQSREYIFKVIFALELNILDAKELLNAINAPFDMRNIEEFIYYICIINRCDYESALKIIKEGKQIKKNETKSDILSIETLVENSHHLKNKEDILKYIEINYTSFNIDNNSKVNEIVTNNDVTISKILKEKIKDIDYSKYFDVKVMLKQIFKDKNIYFNRNTLENWLNNKTPKKSDESREHIYKIAFALDFDIEKTKRLFIKVYKDRPFNIRRINEFVYYICIKNKYDYHYAQEIIEEAKEIEFIDTEIEPTRKMFHDIQFIQSKEDILEYIKNHYSSFCTNNISAKKVVNSLIKDILVKEEEKELIKTKQINEQNSILAQELCKKPHLFKTNHSMTSISGMLTFIYNKDYYSEVSKEDFRESGLPKEVISNMPTKHTFSKKDPSYEELRKMIILLSSYKFWVINEISKVKYDLDDYIFEINGYLLDANLPELYPGSQFDWLFLWCSFQNEPLETFRKIFNDLRS